MIEIARRKVGDRVKLSVADMRQLPALGQFDVVMCLGDAINYLLSTDELEKVLRRMRANLKPNGFLIFDTDTLDSFRTFFAEEICVERRGRRMIWRGLTDPAAPPGVLGEALFEAEAVGAGIAAVPPEIHYMRHFPEDEVHAALESAELQIAGTFGHTEDGIPRQPLDESLHSKAIYIARPSSLSRPVLPNQDQSA
jgi:SAM-dependent methyltransferase